MRITVTPRDALDGGYWAELCTIKGLNVWAASEGMVSEEEEIELTYEEAQELGVIPTLDERHPNLKII